MRREIHGNRVHVLPNQGLKLVITTKHKPFHGTDSRYRGTLASTPWSLCVGAGISVGLVPAWEDLTRRVVNVAFASSFDTKQFKDVIAQTRWSLDALLQGAANRLILDGKSLEDFSNLLEESIYADLMAKARKANLDKALVEVLNNPRWLSKEDILGLCTFFEANYADSTLLQLSRELANANEKNKGPRAIINFNADTLFHALLDIFLIKEHCAKIGKWEYPSASFAKSLRGIESGDPHATPIFHCHGAIAPMPKKHKKAKRRDSRDQLVFREQDYLEIAGNAATWAQSLFLFHAQSSRLLIIGHSLADLNIRKWLSWSHANSIKELASVISSREMTPRHIWVARSPSDEKIREIQEISLLHLGIRVCWVKDWSEVGPTIKNLLAL